MGVGAALFGDWENVQIIRRYGKVMTKREKEVFQLLLQGLSNKQIALELDISEFTARDHVCSILRKNGVRRRAELLAA